MNLRDPGFPALAVGRQNGPVRVLVLGGSWFVGRQVVEDAMARGHDVTVFNRGLAGSPPAGARHVRGDREDRSDLQRLGQHGPWDVVVDVAGSVPAVVGLSARVLADSTDRYVFVSTISAYRDWPHTPVSEESPLWDGDPDADPGTRAWDPDAYGPLKVGCEIACRQVFGTDRLLILRPHVVLGRYEYVGRLPWWLDRMRRGGLVLTPAPNRPIQPVDVEDLSAFLLDLSELQATGVFNVAPDPSAATFGDMLRLCANVTASVAERPAELVWIDENWLVEQGVSQWTEVPLWRNAAAPWGMSTGLARASGLVCRPLEATVTAVWSWMTAGGRAVEHERFAEHGLAPVREASLISAWTSLKPGQSQPNVPQAISRRLG